MPIVSSTEGGSTITGWNLRSSAASFSMYLRYSSRVVAPMRRSSPRASIGFNMFEASIAPSAAPAPTRVWSSSRKVMISPSAALISPRTALSRSSNSPRYLAPATIEAQVERDDPLGLEAFGNIAVGHPPGQALDDRGLAHPGLPDQDRVVLGASGEDLDDPADLVVPPDHRVETALASLGREITPVLLEGVECGLGVIGSDPLIASQGLQRLEDRRGVEPTGSQGLTGGTGVLGQSEKEMLDRQIVVAQIGAVPVGLGQDPIQIRGSAHLCVAVHLRLTIQDLLDRPPQLHRSQPETIENRVDDSLGLAEQGEGEMRRLDRPVVVVPGDLRCGEDAPPDFAR